jgi:hypothetical protein
MSLFGSKSDDSTEMREKMESSKGVDRETMSAAERKGGDIALVASAASVLLSWYEFYGRENKAEGLFVGLWAPTILGFASYLKQRGIEDKLKATPFFGSEAGRALRSLLG